MKRQTLPRAAGSCRSAIAPRINFGDRRPGKSFQGVYQREMKRVKSHASKAFTANGALRGPEMN
jgi:hypothetical protein